MYTVKIIQEYAYLYHNDVCICSFVDKYDGPAIAHAIAKVLNICEDMDTPA